MYHTVLCDRALHGSAGSCALGNHTHLILTKGLKLVDGGFLQYRVLVEVACHHVLTVYLEEENKVCGGGGKTGSE